MKLNVRKLEIIAALLILGVVIFLHLTNFHYGRALIRDETNTVKLALLPLTSGIHNDLLFDSFPPLSIIVFHFWSFITTSDQGFRLLGLLIGLATVAAFWFNARWLGLGLPILSWSIFEFNYIAVRYSDYIRAYSLGIFFILLTFGLIWKLTTTPNWNWKIFTAATLLAVLSVQTMYQNAFFLLAMCMAGMLIKAERKEWKRFWSLATVGLIAGISVLPYISFIKRANNWMTVSKSISDPNVIWEAFFDALGNSKYIFIGFFVLTLLAGLILFYFLPSRKNISQSRKELFIFSIITIIIGSTSFLFFLEKTKIPAQPYYFIPLLAIVVVCLEAIFVTVVYDLNLQKNLKVAIAIVFLVVSFGPSINFLRTRTTNIDIVADRLSGLADKNDTILLNPWLIGISFDRYYKGDTPWMTLPKLDNYTIFHYQVLQEKIAEDDPTASTLILLQKTLISGNQVWLVGLNSLGAIEKPTVNFMAPYMDHWTYQLQQFMNQHAQTRNVIDLSIDQKVDPYENFPLTVFQGWKE